MSPTNLSPSDQFNVNDGVPAPSNGTGTEAVASNSTDSINSQECPTPISNQGHMTQTQSNVGNHADQISAQRSALQQAQAAHAAAAMAEKRLAMSSARADRVGSRKGNSWGPIGNGFMEGQIPGANGMSLMDQSTAALGGNANALGLAGHYPMMMYNNHPLLNQSALGQFNQPNLSVSMAQSGQLQGINMLSQNPHQQPPFFSAQQNSEAAPGMNGMTSGGYSGLPPPSAAKKKKIKGKPKRPLSAYNLFFKYERANILASLENPKDPLKSVYENDGDINSASIKEEENKKESNNSENDQAKNKDARDGEGKYSQNSDDCKKDSESKENVEKKSQIEAACKKDAKRKDEDDQISNDEKESIIKDEDGKENKKKDVDRQESPSKSVDNQSNDVDGADAGSSKEKLLQKSSNSKKKNNKKKIPHGKIGFENLAKTIGQRWSELDETAMGKFKEMALEDMKRYKEEMEVFLTKQQVMQEKERRTAQQLMQNSGALDGSDGEEKQLGKRKLDQVEQVDGDSLSLAARAKHYKDEEQMSLPLQRQHLQIQQLQHQLLHSQHQMQLQQQQNQQQAFFDMNNAQKKKPENGASEQNLMYHAGLNGFGLPNGNHEGESEKNLLTKLANQQLGVGGMGGMGAGLGIQGMGMQGLGGVGAGNMCLGLNGMGVGGMGGNGSIGTTQGGASTAENELANAQGQAQNKVDQDVNKTSNNGNQPSDMGYPWHGSSGRM